MSKSPDAVEPALVPASLDPVGDLVGVHTGDRGHRSELLRTDALQALAQHRFRDGLPVNEGPLTGELGVDSGSSVDVIGLGEDLADLHIKFVACTALCAEFCGLPFRPGVKSLTETLPGVAPCE